MSELKVPLTKDGTKSWYEDERLSNLPFHMRGDKWTAILNEEEGFDLCEHCGGSGNELLSMYRKCPKCDGYGNMKKIDIKYDFEQKAYKQVQE